MPRTRANDDIWRKYDADLQAHLTYLEELAAIEDDAARIRDVQQEFSRSSGGLCKNSELWLGLAYR